MFTSTAAQSHPVATAPDSWISSNAYYMYWETETILFIPNANDSVNHSQPLIKIKHFQTRKKSIVFNLNSSSSFFHSPFFSVLGEVESTIWYKKKSWYKVDCYSVSIPKLIQFHLLVLACISRHTSSNLQNRIDSFCLALFTCHQCQSGVLKREFATKLYACFVLSQWSQHSF